MNDNNDTEKSQPEHVFSNVKREEEDEDIYDEEWASQNSNYTMATELSKEDLLLRRNRIDEIYQIYKELVLLDPLTEKPGSWLFPPKYCYEEQLLNNLNEYREDLRTAYSTAYSLRIKEKEKNRMDASTSCSDLDKIGFTEFIKSEIVDETPRIISIDGNIGSGKSTLYKRLQEFYSNRPDICFVPEPVDTWSTIRDAEGVPILTNLYKDTKKYAFRFQMMAYISRLSLLRQRLQERKHKIIISERCVQTDKNVFAQMLYDDGMIEHDEFTIYNKWFEQFIEDVNMFGIIYVHATPETCHTRVVKRGREGEVIPLEYLRKCHNYHETWLKGKIENNIHKIEAETNITDPANANVMDMWVARIDDWIEKTTASIGRKVIYVDTNPSIQGEDLSISYTIRSEDEEILHRNSRLLKKDKDQDHRSYVDFNLVTAEYLSIIDGIRYLTRDKESANLNINSGNRIVVRSQMSEVIGYINGDLPGCNSGKYKSFKNVIHTSIIGYPNIEFTKVI